MEPGFSRLPGFQRICSSALNERYHPSPSLLGLAWPLPGVRSQEPGLQYPFWKVLQQFPGTAGSHQHHLGSSVPNLCTPPGSAQGSLTMVTKLCPSCFDVSLTHCFLQNWPGIPRSSGNPPARARGRTEADRVKASSLETWTLLSADLGAGNLGLSVNLRTSAQH